jgi:hypothetical protein
LGSLLGVKMSIYQEIGQRKIVLADLDGATNAGPTAGIWSGAGGTIVCVLSGDALTNTTTFTNVAAGTWLPISVKKWVSGPADAVGIAV